MKRRRKTIAQKKKAKKIYDAFRYKKKKLIKIIEDIEKRLKNIYGNRESNKLADYSKKDIEELYKKAVYEKDTSARKKLNELGKEVKGGKREFEKTWANTLQKDLERNIYGNDKRRLTKYAKIDNENFNILMNGLTEKQKLEFLNSASYYGARRYQKPPALSETFSRQVEHDGASYIVQDLIKYYNDHGLPIPKEFIIF